MKVTIGLRPIIRSFVTLWFGFAVLFTVEALIHTPSSASWRDRVLPLLSGIALIGWGLLICALGRLMARKDPEILLAYIEGRMLP